MKNNFIQSTLILMIGGFLSKLLGMITKIYMARIIHTEGMGLYMMILPTFNLVITLSQFGLPIALSKLVSEDTRNNKKLFFSILPIAMIINIIIMIIMINLSPFISEQLLKNKDLTISIQAMSLVIPFTTISSICRSYFFGKSRMIPIVISSLVEVVTRLLIIIKIIPIFLNLSMTYIICLLILFNIISEALSTVILLLFLPKNCIIKKNDLRPNKHYIKESLQISVPNTMSRLIGSIGYFLEPIIITSALLKVGYHHKYIMNEYGILQGYVMPLILLPSFFTLAISQALLPTISKEYKQGRKKYVKKKIKQATILSIIISLPLTILFIIKPTHALEKIYHTKKGTKYLQILSPFCLLQYIQSPLTNALEAMGKSKKVMQITLLSTLLRTILTYTLSTLKIGIWGLILAIIINIVITTYYEQKAIKQYL